MMDPSISLPLLLGLSRSTGSTEREITNENTNPNAKDLKQLPFLQRLHHFLSQSEMMAQWQPHGRAFKIVNESLFKDSMDDGKEEPSTLLEREGFKTFKGGTDEGCWYKDGFTRSGIDEIPILPTFGADTTKMTLQKKKKKEEDVDSPKVSQFMSVTASNDRVLARRYLELSGQNVEMAVTLFLESGGGFGFSSAAASPSGGDEGEMNDEEMQEEEPDFYALPYARAPTRQSPAGKIVVLALKEYWAFRTVRRALLRWIHARKNSSMSIETGSSARKEQCVAKSTQSNCKHGTSHFLMQSLIHPSINVRRAAGRMFLHNLHQVQGMDKKNAIRGMQESLLILLHQVMFDEAPYEHMEQISTSTSSAPQQANEGDPAIQLMGMLTSLVCDGGFSNILIGDHIKTFDGKESGILLNSQLKEMDSFSIESFVASGGLRWACGSIIRLVHMLVNGPLDHDSSSEDGSGSDGDSNQRRQRRWRNGGVSNETIQTRLVLLVDLVYRLVLFGSVPHAVDKHGASSVVIPGLADEDDTDAKPAAKGTSNEDAQNRKKRHHLSQFYEIMSRATREPSDTSRTTSLRNSIRSSLAVRGALSSPPLPTVADKDGSGDGGGDKEKQINPFVTEENRSRRERRKATLERVHSVFWETTLPAAVCVGKIRLHEDAVGTDLSDETYYGNLSPLACLIAAYEILRSPSTRLDVATNKAVAILSRLVDPVGGCCLVVSDSEIPWGLANLLGEWSDAKGVYKADGKDSQEIRSKKRARSASHTSQENQRFRSSPSRLNAGVTSQNEAANRAKRQRTRRTLISSLLERLSDPSQDNPGSSGYPPASAAASSHYSSLLLRGAGGAGPSSASSSANRDGSLSRIIAAAGERLGESSSAIRARALLDRSPGDWRLIDSIAERVNDREVEESGVVMMDDDDDTEFEQEQEIGTEDGVEELIDGPDDDEDGGDEEGEDEDGDEGEDNDTDEGEEENSIFDDAVIVMDQVAAVGQEDRDHQKSNPHRQANAKRVGESSLTTKKEHEQAYLRSAMEILSAQYPGHSSSTSKKSVVNAHSIFSQPPATFKSPLMTLSSEQSLMQSIADIVKPPKKPLNLKIFLRRAPTQEEFFRGALSRNPINLSSLKSSTEDSHEPTFADLRRHIAKDLQMEDSAELLELLVASKIMDINVKLRVAQQVLWKKYVMENSTSASSLISGAGPGHQMINTGSGLSMIFSSSGLSGRLRGSGTDAELDVSQLPPMVVTYRLAGVDGEATEDKVEVEDLEDSEAVAVSCPKALEIKMEKEFGLTRLVANHGGISIVLASVQSYIDEVTACIRRDEIRLKRRGQSTTDENQVRMNFVKSSPCPGLILLRHCANLTDNRKKMLAARAPTMLLRMLLDVLNAMNRSPNRRQRSLTFDGTSDSMDVDEAPRDSKKDISSTESNPTTNALQEIIEMLASDISAEVSLESNSKISKSGSFVDLTAQEGNDDHSTLLLVLKSLRSTNLSPNLRKIISKLLPFLTYGQIDQSKELASFFVRYIQLDLLSVSESNHDLDMMNTFVDTAMNLPPVAVCDNLRQALLSNGFVDKVKSFIMLNAPLQPPPWSPALYPKQLSKNKSPDETKLKKEWKYYFERPGLVEATKILIGLCSKHHPTQTKLTEADNALDLPSLCHWIESTSDNEAYGIRMNGMGILAETLLDGLKESNADTSETITAIRKKTRERKKEIANERRNRALVGMSAFGTLAGSAVADVRSKARTSSAADADELRSTSMFASMFGLAAFPPSTSQRKTRASTKDSAQEKTQPSWMAEMEAMEEEAFACAVCQEGRTLQPSELLGLYAFMKKVTIPSSQGGDKGDIDGTVMLLSLPVSCPRGIIGSEYESFFKRGKAAANAVSGTSQALNAMSAASSISGGSSNSSRISYITSVSAGNAIHCSCHAKAKAADRSHPKAPKSEWEGARLRNSRVTCNVILPLVSSKTSTVPLIAVENALGEVSTITTTILGARPKSMLWNVLHDVRLLMLRMSYGEALNADCGGGSSSSNCLLVLYQLYTADMLSNNADLDDPQVAKHARGLSLGFLAASGIVDAVDFTRADTRSKRLERGLANAAPMAALCSILFYNSTDGNSSSASFAHDITDSERKAPSPNRQWEMHKDKFLAGLLRCAGHRNSVGVTDSGCATSRGISTGSRKNVERARSFIDWSAEESLTSAASKKRTKGRSILEDYAVPLRPMITLYAMLNALSKEFVITDTDENTLSASERLASTLESCLKATCIGDLLNVAEITMDHEAICKYFEKGLII